MESRDRSAIPPNGDTDGEQDAVDTAPRSHSSTRAWLIIVLVVVVVVAAAGILNWTDLLDDRPQAQSGEVVVAPLNATVRGSTATVYVPWGRFRLTIGSPREELPELLYEEKRAPDGGGFVGLELTIGGLDALLPLPYVKGKRYRTPRIALVVDGKRHPVPQLTGGLVTPGGSSLLVKQSVKVFVAIADMPEKYSIDVTYEGKTQTISASGTVAPGRFAALQHVTTSDVEPISCGAPYRVPEQLEGGDSAACTITRVSRLPYITGLGWAERGHEWLVIFVEIEPPDTKVALADAPRDPDPFVDEYISTAYSLDGKQPVSQVKSDNIGPVFSLSDFDKPDQVTFQVPKETQDLRLDITSTFRTHPDAPGLPVSWRVEFP